MFYCADCYELFSEPQYRTERETVCVLDGSPYIEEWDVKLCPYCGGEEVDDAVQCEECGEYFVPDELEDCLCNKCRKEQENGLGD